MWHGGILHLLLNLGAFVPLGTELERSVGSVRFAHLLGVLVLAQDAIFILLSCALALIGVRSAMRTCALGFSGVIFALMVVDNAGVGAPQRSLFGRVDLPSALIPWALMLLIQLVVPGASFLGHLAGLLAGEAWVGGLLQRLSPSATQVANAEAHPLYEQHAARLGTCVAAQPGALPIWAVVRARGSGGPHGGSGGGGGGGSGSVSSVEAAWRLAARGGSAAWARIPPPQKEQLMGYWQRGRLVAVEQWRKLVAALPPQVTEAGRSAHAALAGFLVQHMPAAAALLMKTGRASEGSDDGRDEEVGGEAQPLLAAVAVASGGGSANPSPARRPRQAGSNQPGSPYASESSGLL